MIAKTCGNCGKEFSVSKKNNDRKWCSMECYSAYRTKYGWEAGKVEPVEFSCDQCGKPFHMRPGNLRSYRKKWGKDPRYCSTVCGGKGRKLADEKWQVHCVQCGKPMPIQRRPGGTINRQKKLCSTACRSQFRQEHAPKLFDGGIRTRHLKRGYVWLSIPAYLSRTGKKTYMLQHRYVMEQHLGRAMLKQETIHHINGVRDDNRIENLELFSTHHGEGSRVTDKVAHAIEVLRLYPDFAKAQGVMLVAV